ncbi:uncharacterized protein LOC103704467 isoform X2 [Phoenix dactylifera]|uniref:Uncharacterized protein LOC103704467 isoform X2 n=1 Tax=Phoenix dactylifera TaxID=42345 RepID=A0A8B7BV33_PHODC|nr:uncharacterized protein LOC103704467 isoform X2 [Phoenix dactylifera]
MSYDFPTAFPTVRAIKISYSELKEKEEDLSAKIEEGFGPSGLGLVSISDVPGYALLRQNLLCLSARLTSLPEDVKEGLEDPVSRYNVGWSFGKEKLKTGKHDTFKCSFYANPVVDVPATDSSLMKRYPLYCRPNRWPTNALPELEIAFKSLGKLMLDVGLLLAYHCSRYVSKGAKMHGNEDFEHILQRSRCHKGRLLYYLPVQQSEFKEGACSMSSWSDWHTDFCHLTGLTSGMYMRNNEKITCPDSAAGLYIRMRNDQIVRVVFGEDEIAYQISDTADVLSRGRLCATPHSVQAPKGEKAYGVGRSTFVLFIQPDWDEILNFPEEIPHHLKMPATYPSTKIYGICISWQFIILVTLLESKNWFLYVSFSV